MINRNLPKPLKVFGLLLGVSVGVLILLFLRQKSRPAQTTVKIREAVFVVELVTTPVEAARGLGYRTSLPLDQGMLFVFEKEEKYGFWMKGMEFPIDIIWIKDNVIADITVNVPVNKETPLPVYYPKVPVNKVLEINAGLTSQYGIKVGDRLE